VSAKALASKTAVTSARPFEVGKLYRAIQRMNIMPLCDSNESNYYLKPANMPINAGEIVFILSVELIKTVYSDHEKTYFLHESGEVGYRSSHPSSVFNYSFEKLS
jgi:hypothetical protein